MGILHTTLPVNVQRQLVFGLEQKCFVKESYFWQPFHSFAVWPLLLFQVIICVDHQLTERRESGNNVTLVLAWMGAPCSRRISITRTWPFRAAQWRGVSSSCSKIKEVRRKYKKIVRKPYHLAWKFIRTHNQQAMGWFCASTSSHESAVRLELKCLPLFWHRSELLCPVAIWPSSCCPSWRLYEEVWFHSGEHTNYISCCMS